MKPPIARSHLTLLLICAITTLIIILSRRRNEPRSEESIESICDPFDEPGYLNYDLEKPRSTSWIPFSSSCSPAPDWLSSFEAHDYSALSFLANRTILILGDSVDRNGLEHFAQMLGLERYPVPYDDVSKKGFVPDGWDHRGIPWIVEVPWLDLTFTNGFMYGLDDEDNFRHQPDWHGPGKAEERIDKLFKVHTDQLKYPPSFISLHSGLWDLAFFGRQDIAKKISSDIPLTHIRVEWWQKRMKSLLEHVQTSWPGVPIWLRKLHRVGPVGGASNDWRHVGQGKFGEDPSRVPFVPNNFFTDIRIHQIREMQEQVARTSGIPSFDFGDVWEGWQFFQEKVHPALYPGGPVFAQSLIHHIWLESQGRENWSLNQKRPLSPIRRNTTSSHTTDSGVFNVGSFGSRLMRKAV